MDDNYFKIQLKLVDKHFSYTCKRSEEENLRKAAKNLTDKYIAYSSQYANARFQESELLKLVGFHFSLALVEENKREDMSPFVNRIEQLSDKLGAYIQSFK